MREQNRIASGYQQSSSSSTPKVLDRRTEKQIIYDFWLAVVLLLVMIVCGIVAAIMFDGGMGFSSLSILMFIIGAVVSVIPFSIVKAIIDAIFRPKGELTEEEARKRDRWI